jgi:hypothetical protein
MWSTNLQCFIVRGEKLAFSMTKDVYFFTGIPFHGMALPIEPHIPREDGVETMEDLHCTGSNHMLGLVIYIETIVTTLLSILQ